MMWKQHALPADDSRAVSQIKLNLQSGGQTLGKKLQARFSLTDGKKFAIAMENLDLDSLDEFSYATYNGGLQWNQVAGHTNIAIGNSPVDGLVVFLRQFLGLTPPRGIVIANWIAKRTDPYMSSAVRKLPEVRATRLCTSRLSFFGDEVYHVLTAMNASPEIVEETIREPWHRWLVGVCADGVVMPEDNEFSEQFLDEVIMATKHVFVPAFDNEGWLVWSPRAE